MPSSTIGRGNVIYDFLCGPSLTPVAVAGNTSAEQQFTIAGIQVNDALDINFSGAPTAGLGIVNVRVISANIIGIMFQNSTAGSLTPPSGIYVINVTRPENFPLPVNAI
jgi:hypothetical protein